MARGRAWLPLLHAAACGRGARSGDTGGSCADGESGAAANAFYHTGYPGLRGDTDALFGSSGRFDLDADSVLTMWDGANRTAEGHLRWMLAHMRAHENATAGFRRTGERDGVVYEMHDGLTAAGGGAGYFRLRGTVDVAPELFAALLLDARELAAMDGTIRVMDFARSPAYPALPDGRIWLVYFRQAPGVLLHDLDGVDLSGWFRDPDQTLWQVSVSVPGAVPHVGAGWLSGAIRAVDMHWGYSLRPLDGGARSELVLVCQHDLRNWRVPHWVANQMVGDVLADYVRTAERVGLSKYADAGAAAALRARYGL